MNILLVEDDDLVTEMICATMEMWGQHVFSADSGQSAVTLAERQRIDLVLLDIMLPDGFGYDFIPELKKLQPEIKIVTMTGYNTPDIETKARAQGIQYYMAKPINMPELKAILDHLAHRQHRSLN